MKFKPSKRLLIIVSLVVAILLIVLVIVLSATGRYVNATPSDSGAYLFVYYTGDNPEEESIHFSVSSDGYNFTPLNSNAPIIKQEQGSGSVRDPFLYKADENSYYIIGADVSGNDSSAKNHTLVTWHSANLVDWNEETILDISYFGGDFAKTQCARSPQVIKDEKTGMHMVYWTGACKGDKHTKIYYSYTYNFKTLTQRPEILYECDDDISDADIIFDDSDEMFYLFYKKGNSSDFAYVTSNALTGDYSLSRQRNILHAKGKCGGCQVYKIINKDSYVVMIDEYAKGDFVLEQTTDFKKFKRVNKKDYSFNMYPRQGNVIRINDREYEDLSHAFGAFDNN